MLGWSLSFLALATIAAFLGFGGIAADAAWVAEVVFVALIVLASVPLMIGRREQV